jgi:hypothetical protein
MGWKANCILLSEDGSPVFATFPKHQPERARQLLKELNLDWFAEGMTTFEEGVYLRGGKRGLGAYKGGLIVCGMEIENKSTLEMVQSLYRIYPTATILELGLHSVVNYFHYKLWVAGQVRRHFEGDSDNGVTSDVGELLPVEKPHFENSEVRDGERVFFADVAGTKEEFDVSAYGECLLFSVAGMLLGEELDGYEADKLEIELFAPPPALVSSSWWKFWKRPPQKS